MIPTWILHVYLLLCAAVPFTSASFGDRTPQFRNCVSACESYCVHFPEQNAPDLRELDPPNGQQSLSFILQCFGWSCESECKYRCMWVIEEKKLQKQQKVVQYYGKWPFKRMLGLQEPASVLFSFLNLWVVLDIFSKIKQRDSRENEYRNLWLVNYILNIVAWVASITFHTRDITITERLDYFAATLSIMFTFYASIIQILGIKFLVLIGTPMCIAYCMHVTYLMTADYFDYGWNMKFNAIPVVSMIPLWSLRWAFYRRKEPHVWKACAFVIMLPFAAACEVFDFPPLWNFLDAHALWHALTIPLGYLWGQFVLDQLDDQQRKYKQDSKII
eukprot:m.183616 g.183616  ORF g.183616 m.183616 type:complete len:331 (+) comp15547_c0_seq2:4167-5159(+)